MPADPTPVPAARPTEFPYCEGDEGCNESRTRQYAYGGTTTGANPDLMPNPPVLITLGPTRERIFGKRLCRAHALIRFGVA